MVMVLASQLTDVFHSWAGSLRVSWSTWIPTKILDKNQASQRDVARNLCNTSMQMMRMRMQTFAMWRHFSTSVFA